MDEHETDPQRHEATAQQPVVPPSTTQQSATDAAAAPVTGAPAASPPEEPGPSTTGWQPGTSPQHSGQPHPGQPHPGQPHPGQPHSGQSHSGQSHPGQSHSGQPHPGQSHSGQSHPGQPQAQYPGPQYPGQPYPGQHYPGQPYPGQRYPGQPQPGQQPYVGQGQHDPFSGHGDTGTHQLPVWATSVGADQPEPARPGRGRRILATGAAAVLLALGAGGVGAATALALDDDGGTITSTKTGNSSVTRVVDRSSLADIAAAVQDSVVSINTGSGEGSGVVMTADGFVVTNNHVVASAQGGRLKMVFANGKSADAAVVGTDPRTDLAVVKADGVRDLKPAKFGSSANMRVGDTVLALGSPLGLEGSVTVGIISAKDRTIRAGGENQQPDPFGEQQRPAGAASMSGLLQTDAAINPGNSGGALVNVAGEVIGINTAIATSGQGSGNIGLGFAIPSDKVYDVSEQLKAGKKVSHPALGVSVAEVEGGGAAINSVAPGSAAAKAGLQTGDVINQVNGKPINDSDDLVALIQSSKVGDQVTVTYTRNGVQKTATATLAEAS